MEAVMSQYYRRKKEVSQERAEPLVFAEKEGDVGGVTTKAEAIATRAIKVVIGGRKGATAIEVGDPKEKNLAGRRKRKGPRKNRVRL